MTKRFNLMQKLESAVFQRLTQNSLQLTFIFKCVLFCETIWRCYNRDTRRD